MSISENRYVTHTFAKGPFTTVLSRRTLVNLTATSDSSSTYSRYSTTLRCPHSRVHHTITISLLAHSEPYHLRSQTRLLPSSWQEADRAAEGFERLPDLDSPIEVWERDLMPWEQQLPWQGHVFPWE
jgi:hypothetical protein